MTVGYMKEVLSLVFDRKMNVEMLDGTQIKDLIIVTDIEGGMTLVIEPEETEGAFRYVD